LPPFLSCVVAATTAAVKKKRTIGCWRRNICSQQCGPKKAPDLLDQTRICGLKWHITSSEC
jgi:hypothetical protein